MSHGGARRGAGRPPGSRNKGPRKKLQRELVGKALSEQMRAILGVDAFPGDGVALMQLVYKNPELPIELRLEAAKCAAPYERPRLSSIDHTGEAARDYVARMPMKSVTMDDWAKQLDLELAEPAEQKRIVDGSKATLYQS